jgi:alpha-N-arabinofuranosidase
VNEAGTAQSIKIQIAGTSRIASEGEAVVLAADSQNDTNSIGEPNKVVPHTEKVNGLGASFTREFPPYSVTVLKLKTK